jgi:hypothetical protein
MKTMTEQNPYLTITLTGARPLKILKADWPVIAEATDSAHDNQYESQANRKSKMSLRVRQHIDRRTIVYGAYSYDTDWQNGRNLEIRGGEMIDCSAVRAGQMLDAAAIADIPAAIRRVAEQLAGRIGKEYFGLDILELAHECTANLPAVEV